MGDRRTAAYGWVHVADVDTLAQVDPGNPDVSDCAFHLVRRHFDVRALGVNVATGNAGGEMIESHQQADEEQNQTNGLTVRSVSARLMPYARPWISTMT